MRSGSWSDALALLDEMGTYEIEWDSFSFGTAINAHGKGGGWKRSVRPLKPHRLATAWHRSAPGRCAPARQPAPPRAA